MHCPKCHHQQADQTTTCQKCGVVFAKYFKYHPPQMNPEPREQEDRHEECEDEEGIRQPIQWRDLLLPEQQEKYGLYVLGRALLLAGMGIFSLFLITAGKDSNYAGETFLHNVNLVFHEAGHVFFGILGQFIGSLGGTLGQFIMPVLCGGTFYLKQGNLFGTIVCCWWFAENFLDIAPYINDARAGVLPLVGGNTGQHAPYGFHDWEYLLTETGLINYDSVLAGISHGLGSVLMILTLVWGGMLLWKQYQSL